MSKRKRTPLQKWRLDYAYISECLRDLKQRIRSGAGWGSYKSGTQQAMLIRAKVLATMKMEARPFYAEASRLEWEDRQAARAEAIASNKGHNSKSKESS